MKRHILILAGFALVLAVIIVLGTRKQATAPLHGAPSGQDEEIGSGGSLALTPDTVTLKNGDKITFRVPQGFDITSVAEGLGRARFMALSPDKRVFVTDMKDLSDNSAGKIYILEDANSQTKKFEKVTTYLDHLRNPNSVAFYTDRSGKTWLYVALTDRLVRYPYANGDVKPSGDSQTLATFPDYGLGYRYGGWHLTRTVAIHDDKVYVAVGSSCNACEERTDEPSRAAITVMDPDGSNQAIYANGLRNAVGIKWVGDGLFATNMGVDHLGADVPADTFHKIQQGANYGWPYCYETDGTVFKDTSQAWKRPIDCAQVPVSYAAFDAHSAPLGLEYFSGATSDDPALKNQFLVALHGSSVISINHGNAIVRIGADKTPEIFVDGFLSDGVRRSRPADIMSYGKNGFLFTDDLKGTMYYVYKK